METKERKNMITRPRKANVGKCVEHLEMKFVGNKYDTEFTSTEIKKRYFMHYMHTLTMDVTFTQMTYKKVIDKHR